jgi:hypothetical protein
MSTTNVRVQEAQHRTAQFLQYIVNQAVSLANGIREYNGNPYKVKLNRSELIDGFTAEFFTTTMTTNRYLENLLKNSQHPIIQNGITGKITLNEDKQNCHIQIGENVVRLPKNPDFKPQEPSEP